MISVVWQTLLRSITVAQDLHLVRLYADLLSDYEPDVRPTVGEGVALNVTFAFVLTQIIDVDERNQQLRTNAWLQQTWTDPALCWTPSEYGNITSLHIPYEHVWKPDIVLYNNVLSTDVIVRHDGQVTLVSAAILQSSCVIFIDYYPFDEQECTLKFASWAYDGTKIDILVDAEEGSMDSYMESSEWVLQRIHNQKHMDYFSCCPEPFPYVNIVVNLRRRPMFYVFNLILPCIMMAFVSLLGFYIPCDSGEKVTLGITTLLSMTVFLMLVAESMPPSETLPLIGMFYGVTIAIESLATAMTVVTLNIHHRGKSGRPVPQLAKTIVFQYVARWIPGLTIDRAVFKEDTDSDDNSDTSHQSSSSPNYYRQMIYAQSSRRSRRLRVAQAGDDSPILNPALMDKQVRGHSVRTHKQVSCVLHRMQSLIGRNEKRVSAQERRDAIVREWRHVAQVVDRALLALFLMVTLITTLAVLLQGLAASVPLRYSHTPILT